MDRQGDAMQISTTLLQEFINFWVVIDPIGTLPVFLVVTAGASAAMCRKIAVRVVVIGLIPAF